MTDNELLEKIEYLENRVKVCEDYIYGQKRYYKTITDSNALADERMTRIHQYCLDKNSLKCKSCGNFYKISSISDIFSDECMLCESYR